MAGMRALFSELCAEYDAETGRGLGIIDSLTGRNWGWWPTPKSGGKVVWAALPAAALARVCPAPQPAVP